MTRILLHNARTDHLAAWLREAFPDIDIATCESHATLPDTLARFDPDVVFTVRFTEGDAPYPRAALLSDKGPRWIANSGVGVDHLVPWDTAAVTVTNTAGVASEMIAEFVIGGFLHFTLDVPGMKADQAARHWDARRAVRPLRGATLLIVGLGHTGQAVARLARGFGMRVIGTRASPRPMEGVDEVHGAGALPDLLPRADFVAVATPLIAETHGLIGAAEIAAMKPGAILADVSRGGVVDQSALAAALAAGHLAGAALDVFETEPLPAESPFWAMDNVLLSPHCSAVHAEWEAASFRHFLANLRRFLDGDPLENVVDPARGY